MAESDGDVARAERLVSYAEELARRGFEMEERLGGGAFGNVYKAKQTRLGGRLVAVKFFDNGVTQFAENRSRFEREARLIARVEHRAIPYVITTGQVEEGKIPYTVMQFVRGKTLDCLDPRPSWRALTEIMCEVLAALSAAHSHDVIHRDVSPRNIMVGGGGVYLIDFSIGMCRKYEPGLTVVTRAGSALGAMDYASPEQLIDATKVDHRTDIYSAGVVLFELLAGHCRLRLDELKQASLPDALISAIENSTQRDRDSRFASADEFREVLQKIVTARDLMAVAAIAFCPNTTCEAAKWSPRGYFRGPRIVEKSRATYCEHCGTALVRCCPNCRLALPDNFPDLVRSPKSESDRTSAFCSACGTPLFKAPTCAKCGSFLTKTGMGTDTAKDGCVKCNRFKKPTLPQTPGAGDDDIPF